MAQHPSRVGESTRAVHGGERAHRESNALTTAIHQTATFCFEDTEELRAYAEGRLIRDEYGRYSNPTWRAVQRKICELEGAEEAVLFASGMCAATTSFLAMIPRGGHIIVTSDCYRRTRQFIGQYLSKLDVEATVIDPADTIQLKDAIRDERGIKVIIDSTLASPTNYRPLADGADLVIHSATKYLAGHNDLLAGVVAGPAAIVQPIREAVGVLGGVIDAHAAYLLLRGIKTLGIRMERHNENGIQVARWLEAHPKIERVWYPGLESHPDYAVATRLMKGFAGVVTFAVESDLEGTIRFTDRCRLPYLAPSLGGVESLIEMPALMSYWDHPKEERERFGITDNLVRLACGIEDVGDVIADLEQALETV